MALDSRLANRPGDPGDVSSAVLRCEAGDPATALLADRLGDLEDRQVHRDQETADGAAQEHHHDRLEQRVSASTAESTSSS